MGKKYGLLPDLLKMEQFKHILLRKEMVVGSDFDGKFHKTYIESHLVTVQQINNKSYE